MGGKRRKSKKNVNPSYKGSSTEIAVKASRAGEREALKGKQLVKHSVVPDKKKKDNKEACRKKIDATEGVRGYIRRTLNPRYSTQD